MPNDISALLSSPIEHFINTNVAILEGDKFTDQALNLMKERDVRSVLVSHVGEVVGIVSKTDILFKVMSQGRNPGKVRLREIMTSPGTCRGAAKYSSGNPVNHGQACSKADNHQLPFVGSWNGFPG